MTNDNNIILIDEFKKQFNFEDYLINQQGYSNNPKDNAKGNNFDGCRYKILKQKSGDTTLSILQISKKPNEHWLYKNLSDDNDKGSIIDYLIINQNMNWKQIYIFINNTKQNVNKLSDYNKIHVNKNTISIPTPTNSNVKIITCNDYQSNKYFIKRNINDTILNNQFIKESLKDIKFNFNEKNLYGTVFLIKNEKQKVTSFNMKSDFFKKGMFLKPRNNGIWFAIPPKVEQVFIGEAATDVISFYKLYPKPNTLLISSEGNLSNNYIQTANKLLPNLSTIRIHLINDNDIAGTFFDLKWVINIYQLPLTIALIKKTINEEPITKISIKSDNPKINEILDIYKNQENHYNLLQSFSITKKIIKLHELDVKINKSKYKDWNAELTRATTKKKSVHI